MRRARARAIAALGGSDGEAALARFKKALAKVRAGKLDVPEFVSLALSPGFFGSDGWGALSEDGRASDRGTRAEPAGIQATVEAMAMASSRLTTTMMLIMAIMKYIMVQTRMTRHFYWLLAVGTSQIQLQVILQLNRTSKLKIATILLILRSL